MPGHSPLFPPSSPFLLNFLSSPTIGTLHEGTCPPWCPLQVINSLKVLTYMAPPPTPTQRLRTHLVYFSCFLWQLFPCTIAMPLDQTPVFIVLCWPLPLLGNPPLSVMSPLLTCSFTLVTCWALPICMSMGRCHLQHLDQLIRTTFTSLRGMTPRPRQPIHCSDRNGTWRTSARLLVSSLMISHLEITVVCDWPCVRLLFEWA